MNLVVDTSILKTLVVSEPECVKMLKQTESIDLLARRSVRWLLDMV